MFLFHFMNGLQDFLSVCLAVCNGNSRRCRCHLDKTMLHFSSSRVLSLALSYDPLKIFHGKIIILIAEMAVHLNVLAFLDHLVKFFSSDADQRFSTRSLQQLQ